MHHMSMRGLVNGDDVLFLAVLLDIRLLVRKLHVPGQGTIASITTLPRLPSLSQAPARVRHANLAAGIRAHLETSIEHA